MRSSLLTALVVAELLWGFGMIAFEVFLPPRLAQVSGGVEEADRLLGPAITVAWVLSGVGAACAPWLVRRFGSAVAGCTLRFVQGGTVVAMGLAAGPAGLIVAYLANYWAHGATAPVHYGMVHRAVESSHRATVVSANSLTSQVGWRPQRHPPRRPRRRHQHHHRDARRRRRPRRRRPPVPGRPLDLPSPAVDPVHALTPRPRRRPSPGRVTRRFAVERELGCERAFLRHGSRTGRVVQAGCAVRLANS